MLEPFKTALADMLHMSKDALHIHLGLGLFLIVAALTRRSPGSWLPWMVLLAFELVNEGFDLAHDVAYGVLRPMSLLAAFKDILNTMLWPSALMIAVRLGWLSASVPTPSATKPDGRRA